ncbi:WD G-beta repeat-containing protein, putative [Babesia ovata]|uniref:WD G-beta repeat-containing protein, putative n=1 Tax=Babesia ovata TaxID=189622 RepID=A0A2H6K6A6_9APIC|nr:WD G-beta repeat-containing protein, putative [Babesia ovata]GBE58522.1 WD G-beta repeat-containing protein, putative [Babesia ovata]
MGGNATGNNRDEIIDDEEDMSSSEEESEPTEETKRSAINKALSKMDLGDVKCIRCIKCKKARPEIDSPLTGVELDDLYDHLATGGDGAHTPESDIDNDVSRANRDSAFFNRIGDTHEHYMKHFAPGSFVNDLQEDESTDGTDLYLDEGATRRGESPVNTPLQRSVFHSMEDITHTGPHLTPAAAISTPVSIEMEPVPGKMDALQGQMTILSAIDEQVSDQQVGADSTYEAAGKSTKHTVHDQISPIDVGSATATLDNKDIGTDVIVDKLDVIGAKESASGGEQATQLAAVMQEPTESPIDEKKDVPTKDAIMTETKADETIAIPSYATETIVTPAEGKVAFVTPPKTEVSGTPSTTTAIATLARPKEDTVTSVAETKIKPEITTAPKVDTQVKHVPAEDSKSLTPFKRSDAKDFGTVVDADKKQSAAPVPTATEMRKETVPKAITMEEAMQANAKAGALSAMQLSPGKDILALGTVRGVLTVILTGDTDVRTVRRKKQKPADVVVNEPIPDSMLWGLMTISPVASTEAHLSAINHIQIEAVDADDEEDTQGETEEIATIITSGSDSYLRVWSLHSEGNKYLLTLIGAQVMHSDPVAAIPIFVDGQVLVAFADGDIECWKITDRGTPRMNRQHKMIFTQTKQAIDAECDILRVDVSPTGQTFAVESAAGWLVLYDSETMKAVGNADCRNRRGKWASGANVTGVDWSRRENLILVTTSDCRIRLLTATAYEEDELLDLEKFKGHRNVKMPFKAQLANNDEYVVCPSEDGFIYVWKISVDASKKNIGEDDMQSTNTHFVRFKFNAPKILPHLAIFNPGEWKHIRQLILQQEKNGATEVTPMPSVSCKCLPFGKHYTTPQSIDVGDLDTQEHILLAAPENSGSILYSLISLNVLWKQLG